MTLKGIFPRRCQHLHVSGRQCERRLSGSRDYCGIHRSIGLEDLKDCKECVQMLDMFPVRRTLTKSDTP